MLNSAKKYFDLEVDPNSLAISFYNNSSSLLKNKHTVTFGKLNELCERAQTYLRSLGLQKGDSILLFEMPSPLVYSLILASLASGYQILVVEPWLSVENINHIIEKVKPKVFFSKTIGKAWALRIKSIRKIKTWTNTDKILKSSKNPIFIQPMDENDNAILTFTSGTSGKSKGVFRKHKYLIDQGDVVSKYLNYKNYPGTDLTIFTNLVICNLANAKGSIIIPADWNNKALKQLSDLPQSMMPDTLAAGPAFLKRLMEVNPLNSLKSIHVGGALTDCWIFEKAFKIWPEAKFDHVYGSSEAEPVAVCDAKVAVERSREKGFFQTLYIGNPIDEITSDFRTNSLWVTGKHVSPMYLDDDDANKKNKRKDEQGYIWHNMGDRIIKDENGHWYTGRDFQSKDEFLLEQSIYQKLKTSKAFVFKRNDHLSLFIDSKNKTQVKKIISEGFPQIKKIYFGKMIRDKRHRARVNRKEILQRMKL